jgi:cell division septal protein FtsQ
MILPLFRVQSIRVEGNDYYSAQVILDLSGIHEGDELLAVDAQKAANDIYATGYFSSVSVSGKFPGVVCINVTEKTNLMYTEYNGNYLSLDGDFRVLEISDTSDRFAGLLYVELPDFATPTVGNCLCFDNSDVNMEYVNQLADALRENGLLDYVTVADCSQKYNVSFVLNNTLRLEVGKVADMDAKLALAERILQEKQADGSSYVTLDVSNLKKSTYRILSADEFFALG